MSPRWRKLWGDARQNRGRLLMMVAASAAGIFAVATIAVAYVILARELNAAYLATRPASATLGVANLTVDAVAAVRARPGVTWAERGTRLWGRVAVRPPQWLPLLLFVRADFAQQRLARLELTAGRWPSGGQEIVLERTAMEFAQAALGQTVVVQGPAGGTVPVTITGVVHDASVPPARMQQAVYGYGGPELLQAVDGTARLTGLSVLLAADAAGVERAVIGVADGLRQAGLAVGEIRIPPRHHPHWGMMQNIIRMLLVFGLLTLVLAALLTATLTAALLAPQVRSMGIMRAVGAVPLQLAQLYAVLLAAVGTAAAGIGLSAGLIAGREFARVVAHTQNVDLHSLAVPGWLVAALAVGGVGLPLLAGLIPVMGAARRSVRTALDHRGGALTVPGGWWRGGQTWLMLGLLATAGGLFITSINVRAAWDRTLVTALAERRADLEIAFAGPQLTAAALAAAAALPGVTRVESYSDEPAAPSRSDGLTVTHTFPDGGHGSLRLATVPANTAFVIPTVVAGRWLSAADAADAADVDGADGAVVNEAALAALQSAAGGDAAAALPGIGRVIRLMVRGRVVTLRIVGVVAEHLVGATVYTSPAAAGPAVTSGLRMALGPGDTAARSVLIEQRLDDAGFPVIDTSTRAAMGRAQAGHLLLLVQVLIALALLMALVGALGLASALGTRVAARTREFGILRAIGADDTTIRVLVLREALWMAGTSVALAAALSLPLSFAVGRTVGGATLGSAWGLMWCAAAIPQWLVIALASGLVACALPVRRALRVTVREALAEQTAVF